MKIDKSNEDDFEDNFDSQNIKSQNSHGDTNKSFKKEMKGIRKDKPSQKK